VPEFLLETTFDTVIFQSRCVSFSVSCWWFIRISVCLCLTPARFAPESLRSLPLVSVFHLCVLLVDSRDFLSNPHLRNKIVDVRPLSLSLSRLPPRLSHHCGQVLGLLYGANDRAGRPAADLFSTHPQAARVLPALMREFVDVERSPREKVRGGDGGGWR
jgi:hypothetical protein